MNKQELIAKLRTNADDALTKLRTVPDDAWQQGRYENGWNARQILAHVASIEWTYPRLIDLAKQPLDAQATTVQQATAATPQQAASTTSAPAPTSTAPPMTGGVNSYND